MTLKDKIVAILEERSFETRDGGQKTKVIDASDFEQIALDILETLSQDYSFEPDDK